MSGHTEGPWRTDPECGNESVLGPNGTMAADCAIFGRGTSRKRNVANARLIAAAPDLLAALKVLADDYASLGASGDAGFWDWENNPKYVAARAAIAKAEQP